MGFCDFTSRIFSFRRRKKNVKITVKTKWTGYEKEIEVPKAKIILSRKKFTNKVTMGEFTIDGKFFCFTLEDTVRDPNKNKFYDKEEKVHGETAIPSGIYELIISHSNRFKKWLPLLLNVPFYKGIRIHAGNRPENTEGCILIGFKKGPNFIYESSEAMEIFLPKLEEMTKKEKVYIEITGGVPAKEIDNA